MRRGRIRFFTTEIETGYTKWFDEGEMLPLLDWSKVTDIETSKQMTIDEFRTKNSDVVIDWSKVVSIETSDKMTVDQFRTKFPHNSLNYKFDKVGCECALSPIGRRQLT